MDTDTQTDPLDASFDIVARQDAADQALGALRTDVEEVKSRLDKVGRAAARRALASDAAASPELKGFVDGYLRRGRETELKSLTQGVPADGGYAVPREIDAAIAAQLKKLSPIRSIAQVVQVGTSGYRKLISTGGTQSGWVSEIAARPETTSPKFQEIAPPSGELYANPSASQAMLDDAVTFAVAAPPANFLGGTLRWLDGAYAGLGAGIAGVSGAALVLDKPLDLVLPAGTRAILREGCDRTLATCAARFGNALNFQGEPFLPGNDHISRYASPGGGGPGTGFGK